MDTDEFYAPLIEQAFQNLLRAPDAGSRRFAGGQFTRLVNARNRARTAQRVAEIERRKGLRE